MYWFGCRKLLIVCAIPISGNTFDFKKIMMMYAILSLPLTCKIYVASLAIFLLFLNVAKNHLEGPIPDNLSSCTNLNSLNVFGDKLNRTIPSAFKRLESITYLNLSSNNLKGPIPIELSRIGNLATLSKKDLSNKSIAVATPWPIGDLEHLLKLNLSKNNLTGLITMEFSNLRSIDYIHFNNLSIIFS
ncbi:hypothetical protein DCAR_0311293 [Daucus carota subsp. sativus]|uniref:Leucine-rich repeat-containing N-terminal plant-type domain-containing protein n=1 Tax=Daucus carota subsp. sativus TaxID=79200 RepID=A0AAF0WLY0_DAUCS|nr:hypothetical protein DCAR_0311293 [Daucus carota subsp. sativus]